MLKSVRALLVDWPTTMFIPRTPPTSGGKTLGDAAIRSQWEAYANARLKGGVCDTLHVLAHVQHLRIVPLSQCGRSITTVHHGRLWANLPVTDSVCEEDGSGVFQVFKGMERAGVEDVRHVLRVSQHADLLEEASRAGVHMCGVGGEFDFRGVHPRQHGRPGQVLLGVDTLDELIPLLSSLCRTPL